MKSLHPLLPDHELPAALKRPLVFGDREQLEALAIVEEKINAMTADTEDGADLKRYAVMVEISCDFTEYVFAGSKQDAEDKVMDDLDLYGLDFDKYVTVKEAALK